MKAIGYTHSLAIENAASLIDLTLDTPVIGEHDLLVRVAAVSVNPVDTKIRLHRAPNGKPEVLGWDAVGTVEAFGAKVRGFQRGERVFYAGAIQRPGCNSEWHAVDARLVGHAPASLDDAQAAALPLTSITAWELLFDRLAVLPDGGAGQTLLITGAAGGVGSMLIQLARRLTRLTVIATASRPESVAWVRELGAHHVLNHHQAWMPQLSAIGLTEVALVASLTHTGQHFEQIVEVLAPQGKLALIDDGDDLSLMKLKAKSISLHWEMMFTRSMFQTPDMQRQGELLEQVAKMVDGGSLRSTFGRHMGLINAANLRAAHSFIESGKAVGKVVLAGWN
ncbi:zinc-binding alcohol dehydrogenase family protein [soil metagenome]